MRLHKSIVTLVALTAMTANASSKHRTVRFTTADGIEDNGPHENAYVKRAVQWSANSDPVAAADEDYHAMMDYCDKIYVDLMASLVTIAEQPGNHAGNGGEYEKETERYVFWLL